MSQGTVLTAPNGTGVTANAARFEYAVSDTDTTTICTHATVNGVEYTHCGDGEVTQIPPQAVIDLINVIKQGFVDPLVCSFLRVWGPTINNISPANLWVDPTDGDVYLFTYYRVYDCPIYGDRDPGHVLIGSGH